MGKLLRLSKTPDPEPPPPRRFSLQEAQQALEKVRPLTEEAVREVEALKVRMEETDEEEEREEFEAQIQRIIAHWSAKVQALGGVTKGVWLVDFDNGEGYYCWQHGEDDIHYFHGYEEGFAGRIRLQ